jgi:dTMP kinase
VKVFIVIDGLDGSGKSTQARLICGKLARGGRSFILRSHPSPDNFFGRMGRGYLLLEGKRAMIAASVFYLADVFRSVLLYRWRRVDHIVFVRYLMGTAYLPRPLHRVAYLFFYRLVPTSDHMYFIDVRPEEAHRRLGSRVKKEMFETLERLTEVREKALGLTVNGGWTIIDGNKPWKAIHLQLCQLLGL